MRFNPVSPIMETEQQQKKQTFSGASFVKKQNRVFQPKKNRDKQELSLTARQMHPKYQIKFRLSMGYDLGCFNHPKNKPLDPLSGLVVKIFNPLGNVRINIILARKKSRYSGSGASYKKPEPNGHTAANSSARVCNNSFFFPSDSF